MRRLLALATLAAALGTTAATGIAHADPCYGTANTVGVCYGYRTVYSDCIYVGNTCTPVVVAGPVCLHGWTPNASWVTSTC